MADQEAIADSSNYQEIIENLKGLKERLFVSLFEDARKKRAAQRHD
jgi:hypothetical protein